MSDNLNLSEMSYKDRTRYQHLNLLTATKELLKVSHVKIPEEARVARVTVVLDIPGKKNMKNIDFAPCDPLYTDHNGNLNLKAKNATVENME